MLVREFCQRDEQYIKEMYKRAFAGLPWFEDLSVEEVEKRWKNQSTKRGFSCLVADEEGKVIGGTWWDTPNLEELRHERGNLLAELAKESGIENIVWLRETCIDPLYKNKGVARQLKKKAVEIIKQRKPCLLLTRMRDDNLAIITLNTDLGFRRTGIRITCSIKRDTFHEYWYLKLE